MVNPVMLPSPSSLIQDAERLNQLDQAVAIAVRAHQDQVRRVDKTPYVVHPIVVAFLLCGLACEPEIVICALLHDVVEDTSVTLEEIDELFGAEIAALVSWVTEKKGTWEARKLHMIEQLRYAPREAKLVAAADKYHNLYQLLQRKARGDAEIWDHFHRPAPQQAWFYRSIYNSILFGVEDRDEHPLFIALGELIRRLFDGIASHPPQPQRGST